MCIACSGVLIDINSPYARRWTRRPRRGARARGPRTRAQVNEDDEGTDEPNMALGRVVPVIENEEE